LPADGVITVREGNIQDERKREEVDAESSRLIEGGGEGMRQDLSSADRDGGEGTDGH
jgi:hypothetical protein